MLKRFESYLFISSLPFTFTIYHLLFTEDIFYVLLYNTKYFSPSDFPTTYIYIYTYNPYYVLHPGGCGSNVIFLDPVSKRSKLTFVQEIAQIISLHSFQDFFVSDSIDCSYSWHVTVAAYANGIYLFLHQFCCCPGFSVVEDYWQDDGVKQMKF